jgi:molybdopterin synthase sulfur carrier subunit
MFGRLADIAGNSVSVKDVTDTNGLQDALHKSYPELANTKYIIAIDKQVIKENTELNKNSTVALLPPFSGG